MNSSNLSNLTDTFYDENRLFGFVFVADHVFRYFGIIVHAFFILVLIVSPEIRTKNMFYVNHATVVSIFFPIVLFVFMFGDTPNFTDPSLNQALCTVTAYFRDFANFIRPYSILIIAIYRYVAVFHLSFFSRVNKSNLLLITPILITWILSIVFPIIINKSLNTNVSTMLCLNGSTADSNLISILYFAINFLVLIVIPNFVTMVLYVRIMLELRRMKYRVNRFKISVMPTTNTSTSSNLASLPAKQTSRNYPGAVMRSSSTSTLSEKREKSFAKHFFFMCTSVILTSAAFSIFYLSQTISNYFNIMYYWLPVLRILVSIGVTLVPITSLYFHPARARLYKWIQTRA